MEAVSPDEIVETSDADEREAIRASSGPDYWRKFTVRTREVTPTLGNSTSASPISSRKSPLGPSFRSISPIRDVIEFDLPDTGDTEMRDVRSISQIAGPSSSRRTPSKERHASPTSAKTPNFTTDVIHDIDTISLLESPLSSPPRSSLPTLGRTPPPGVYIRTQSGPGMMTLRTPFFDDRLVDPSHVTPATINPEIPVELVDKSRYALRTRNAKQLNPYVYDQLLYKKQMRANPDAIVKVVSPIKHAGHVDRIAQEMLDFIPDGSPSRPRKRKSTNHTPPGSDHSELSDSRLSGGPAEHRPRRKRPGYRVSGPKHPRPFPFHDLDVVRSGSPLSIDVRMLITLIVVSHYSSLQSDRFSTDGARSGDAILDYSSAGDLPPTTPLSPRSDSLMPHDSTPDFGRPDDDDDDLNLISDNSPIPEPSAVPSPTRNNIGPSSYLDDSDSSSVIDLSQSRSSSPESEIEGLKELKKVWPAVMVRNYLEKAGDAPARRKRLERREPRKQDGPMHPGETRVRETANPARHPFAFKGDTDSSDTDAGSSSSHHPLDKPRDLSSSPPQRRNHRKAARHDEGDGVDSAESAEEHDYFTLMSTRLNKKRHRKRESNATGQGRKAPQAGQGLARKTNKKPRRVGEQRTLHVFATSGRRVASGRRRNIMLTVDLEDEGLHEALAPVPAAVREKPQAPLRITAHPPLKAPNVRLSRTRPKPVPDPVISRLRRTVEIISDSGIPFLPSGITFPADTYLERGWLHELILALSPDSDITPPAAFSAHGLDLSPDMPLPEFLGAFKLVCEGLLERFTTSSVDGQDEQTIHWDHAVHGICQLVSWLPRNFSVEDLTQLQITVDDQLSQLAANCCRTGQPSDVELTIYWFMVEVAARLRNAVRRRDGITDSSKDSLLDHIMRLVQRLLEDMDNTAQYIRALAHKSQPISVSHRSAESWVCLLHLVETCDVAPPESRTHALWWVLQNALQAGGHLAQPGLEASEALWRTIFSLCALSQFSRHGMSTSQCRIGPSWQMVVFSLTKIRLTDEPTGNATTVSQSSLRKRDEYVRIVASRCLILVDRWHWNLDRAMDMFNELAEIFRSRSFANLRGEPSDFASFIIEQDLELLFSHSPTDSTFELFLKLIVRTSHRSLEDLRMRKPLPGRSKKLLSLAVPVGSIFAATSVMPTNHELSMLYNRFSAITVAIHLDPTPTNAHLRLAHARRYAEFSGAQSNVRSVCIRAAMYFAILLHQCHIPVEPAFDWLGDMTLIIEDEYIRSCAAGQADKEQIPNWAMGGNSLSCMRLLLDCVRHVVESCTTPQMWVIETLVPAILNGRESCYSVGVSCLKCHDIAFSLDHPHLFTELSLHGCSRRPVQDSATLTCRVG